MSDDHATGMRRRDLLALIGTAAGGAAMYQAMTSLGLAAESTYAGPIKLDGEVFKCEVTAVDRVELDLRRADDHLDLRRDTSNPDRRC